MDERQYLKAIVWPRPPTEKIPHHRYVIVGMLVTNKPIQSLEGLNRNGISEFLIDGPVYGIADLLDCAHKGTPDVQQGEAGNWLVALDDVHIWEDLYGEEEDD